MATFDYDASWPTIDRGFSGDDLEPSRGASISDGTPLYVSDNTEGGGLNINPDTVESYAPVTGADGKTYYAVHAPVYSSGREWFETPITHYLTESQYNSMRSGSLLGGMLQDLGPIGQIGLAIATGGLSIPQQIAAQMAIQVASGKSIEDAVKSAAISFAVGQIPGVDAVKEGTAYLKDFDSSGVLSKAFQSAATSATKAALTGKDISDALLSGAVSGGASGAVNFMADGVERFETLSPSQQQIVKNAISGVVSGKPIDQVLVNSAIAAANAEVQSFGKPKPADFDKDSFDYNQIFDPSTAGAVDLLEKPFDSEYKFTTDFGVGADYGLGPKSDGLGFQITAPPEVFNPDGSVNYELLDYDALSQLGMDMPKSANLDGMGGGQGLRIPVNGGYITEDGFVPEGYTPDLGDPNSFINQRPPGGDVSIQGALNAGAKAPLADLNK